ETYLYVGALHFNKVAYPIFYVPLRIELQERIFRISADPQIYVNKKALEFAAQETSRELGHSVPLTINERILYIEEGQSFTEVLQTLLDQWCADLALKPPIDLTNTLDQKSQRSQIAITNAIHFGAFDKGDESLLNDYEDLLVNLGSASSTAVDFEKII